MKLGEADRDSGKEWGTAINDYLAKQKGVEISKRSVPA